MARQKEKDRTDGSMFKTDKMTNSGNKRGWQMPETEADLQQVLWQDKRVKGENQKNVINNMQVEEASLNCPHLVQ